MKVIYDSEADTLTLILRDEPVMESEELAGGVIVDYGHDGRAVAIEMLDATQQVQDPRQLAYELRA